MQLCNIITAFVYALSCAETVAGTAWPQRRQETSTDIITTSDESSPSTPSATEDAASSATSGDGSRAAEGRTSATSATEATTTLQSSAAEQSSITNIVSTDTKGATSSPSLSTTAASTAATAATTGSSAAKHTALPLQPKITPALGIAGVILLLTGIALCLVGIKHKWLYIFLSTAYLAGLGVTVLVIYVMNPPVSSAVQGAYMVAAIITGLIFGALALIFKEITEGLGCLLGGFCLAMWFLVLSPGGLISSTTGRAILIAAFCLATYALSFSHYTRNYALIFGTSFSGAQIAVIGIDCFSRAGLKEFWLYIWNLNDDAFPIDTNTYPITRGIKVEIACVVIVFVFGLMSQLKIWKVIKERRAKRADDLMRENEDRDQFDQEIGREMETNNERDRAQWEAVYGDKVQTRVHTDSGVGSSIDETNTKRSASVREREIEDIEMVDMLGRSPTHPRKQNVPKVTVRAASEDEGSRRPPTQSQEHLLDQAGISASASQESITPIESQRTSMDDWNAQSETGRPPEPDVPTGPEVVPLPFSIPGQEPDELTARPENADGVLEDTPPQGDNDYSALPLTHMSLKQMGLQSQSSADPFEDDEASSVAATADEQTEMARLSPRCLSPAPLHNQLHNQLAVEENGTSSPNRSDEDSSSNQRHSFRRSFIELPMEEDDEEAVVRPLTVPEEERPTHHSDTSRERSFSAASPWRPEDDIQEGDDKASMAGSLTPRLPRKLSKVAMTYRTNEWAKHITEADQPEADGDSPSSSPGIQVDHAFAQEAAKPVDGDDLKPVVVEEPKPKMPRNTYASSKNPYRQSTTPSPRTSAVPVHAFQRSGSAMSLNRQSSTNSLGAQPRLATQGLRNASALLYSQPLVESPVEEAETKIGPRNLTTPMSMASISNLMDERHGRMLRRPKSTSFNALASTPDPNVVAPSDSPSSRNIHLDDPDSGTITPSPSPLDEENMTLAERRAYMQQRRSQSRSASRQETWPAPYPRASMTANQNIIYDSHQPKRNTRIDAARQSSMLAQWRQSLQQDAAARKPLVANDQAHLAMVNERRQVQMQSQMQEEEREKRQSAMDMAMRSGQLHNAHRDRLRRMQAEANKRTPQ